MSLDCGGNELMSTGDLESSGNGFGMDGTEEENDSTAFALKHSDRKNNDVTMRQKLTNKLIMQLNDKYRILPGLS